MCGDKYASIIKSSLNTYELKSNFKPYKITWKSKNNLISESNSIRDSIELLASHDSFKDYYLLSPAVNKNEEIYMTTDTASNYSGRILYKYDSTSRKIKEIYNFNTLKLYYDTAYLNWGFSEVGRLLLVDSLGTILSSDVNRRYLIKVNTNTSSYRIIDSHTNSTSERYWTINYLTKDSIYSVFHSRTTFMDSSYKYNLTTFSKLSGNIYIDNIINYYNLKNIIDVMVYKDFTFVVSIKNFVYNIVKINNNFSDTIVKILTDKSIFETNNYSFTDGQGNIYTHDNSYTNYNRTVKSNNNIYFQNFNTNKLDSINANKFNKQFCILNKSVQIDCSGNIYFLASNNYVHTKYKILELYKIFNRINTTVYYDGIDTLTAIVHYYDGDSLVVDFATCDYKVVDTAACDLIRYRGILRTQSGVYYDTVKKNNTKDSLYTLKLTINKTKFDTFHHSACDSFIYKSTNYKTSGAYSFKYIAANTCDSFHTLDVKINPSKKTSLNQFSCTSYLWHDSTYTKTGTYTRLFKTIHQCDSLVSLDLNIGLNNKLNLYNGINYTALADSVSYQWFRCNPWRKITNETKKTFTTTTKGSYAVVVSNGTCNDTSDCLALYSSSVIPVNTGILGISIYPNPFNSNLTIDLTQIHKEINIKIYDMTGRQVLNMQYKNLSICDLKLVTLSKGSYYLQIKTENNTQFFKILKD